MKINNHNILIESENLIKKVKDKYPVYDGRRAEAAELQELQRRLNFNLPGWYFDLYLNHSIIDSEFGFQEYEPEEEYDGISFVIWGDIKSVIQESFELEPGISMLKKGYLFVASCSLGSGDPLFISIQENADDPSVYRIYHDDFQTVRVSIRLSEFFNQAVI